MDPKLSSEAIIGLRRLGNSTLVNDEVFIKLLDCCGKTITQLDLSSNIAGLAAGSSKGDIIKESHSALLSLIVEAARMEFSSESLHSFLEDKANWPNSRAKKLSSIYAEAFPIVQASLARIGSHPPHIVDVQWCLNHSIKSSSDEHTSTSVIAVQLETEGILSNQEEENLKFMCTVPELQDFVSKLKEALRQMEHVAQSSHS